MKTRAVIICPGRGTYNAGELGYLARHHAQRREVLDRFDAVRRAEGQIPLQDLDSAAHYDAELYTRGDTASGLIFASSFCDALAISDRFDVVGVTGNSMGWYSALAVAGATSPDNGFRIANTMGTLMQTHLIGGQSLHPFVDEDWRTVQGRREDLLALVHEIATRPNHELAVSIRLGGMLVVAGNAAGLDAFEGQLPKVQGRFPMRLKNHAAFHTVLQEPVAAQGRAALPQSLFQIAQAPLVDGRGEVWWPGEYTVEALRDYTLNAQVVRPYDFTSAIRVAARTFAPDVFIITGPGTTLGGAVAQSLIAINWRGLTDKTGFLALQATDPVLLSIGRAEDRAQVT